MGYDVTFHPVDVVDLQHYVFDVVDEPKLAPGRADELTAHPEKHRMAMEVYRTLERYRDSSRWTGDVHFGSIVAYCAAAVAGFLHPFWYARNGSITFIGRYDDFVLGGLFTSLTKIARGKVADMPDRTHGILGLNYTGSGLIESVRLPGLLDKLKALARTEYRPSAGKDDEGLTILDAVFDYDGLSSLLSAVHYALDHELGLMEASDVVVPMMDQTVTDPEHFRENDPDERDRLLSELWPEFGADWRPRRLR